MGENSLIGSGGDNAPITAELIDQFRTALDGDLVPRGPTGVPSSLAASLGTDVFEWDDLYVRRIILNGQELTTSEEQTGTPGGPGSITAFSSTQNGVVSWLAPAGRPGMCGAIHKAGSAGVVITADNDNPLRVKLDGVVRERKSNITGGTIPPAFTQNITPVVATTERISSRVGGSWASESERRIPVGGDRAKFRYSTGAEFFYHDPSGSEVLPDSYGHNICIKSTGGVSGTTYTYAQRVSNSSSPAGERNVAKLKMGEVWNTSTTAQEYGEWQLPFHTTHQVIGCAALFVDPLTATWQITIAPRIVGSVNTTLPTGTFNTGDCVFLESDQRWHRWSGSGWAQTSFVLLALLAVDGTGIEAVLPVRSEESLSAMFNKKFAVLGDPISREGEVDGDLIRFGGQSSDVEEKGFAELGGQSKNQQGTSAVVDTSDATKGSLQDGEMFCVYLDVEDNSYYFESSPPVPIIYRERLLLAHANRQRLFVGSFVVTDDGSLLAQQRLNTNNNERNRLGEGDDDVYLISNPCLFGRSKLTDVGWHAPRRFQVQVRGRGTNSTGTTTLRYRWYGSSSFYPGHHINKPRYDDLFFSFLTPHITEEIRYDTDDPSGSTNLIVAFSQWDEASWLYATGLTEAAREGRAAGAAGAGAAGDDGGAVASVDAPQYAPASVGAEAIAPYSIDIPAFDTNNAGYAGAVLEIAADPQDANLLRLQWGDGSGAGRVPFSVSGEKLDNKFIKSTGPNDNQQEWVFLNYGAIQDAAATEADIFDSPVQNTGFVGNFTLFEAFNERDRQLDFLWSDWSVSNAVQFATIATTGTINLPNTYGAVTLQQRNVGTFNIGTSAIVAGDIYICGTDCAGLPTLGSGTLRAGLLALGSDGVRTFMPIDNPESDDAEEFFIYSAGSWQPIPYNHERLYSHARGLPADSRWNGMAGHLIGGPTANVFNDEASMGERNDGTTRLLRVIYSTSTNMFSAVLAGQRFEVHIQDGQITDAMLAAGIDGAKIAQGTLSGNRIISGTLSGGRLGAQSVDAGKIVRNSLGVDQIAATVAPNQPTNTDLVLTRVGGSATMQWKTGGGSPSHEDIVRFSTPVSTADSADRTLPSDKSFDDYDYIIIERKERPGGGSNPIITAHSPMFLRTLSVGTNNEIISFPNHDTNAEVGVNVDLKTATTYRFTFVGSDLTSANGEGVSAIIGVKA